MDRLPGVRIAFVGDGPYRYYILKVLCFSTSSIYTCQMLIFCLVGHLKFRCSLLSTFQFLSQFDHM